MEHLDAIGHLPPITDEGGSKTATTTKGVVGKSRSRRKKTRGKQRKKSDQTDSTEIWEENVSGVNDIINTYASESSGTHKEHSTIISVPSIRTRVKTVETLTQKMIIWMWSEVHQLLLMVFLIAWRFNYN